MDSRIPATQGASNSIGACTARAPASIAGRTKDNPLTPF